MVFPQKKKKKWCNIYLFNNKLKLILLIKTISTFSEINFTSNSLWYNYNDSKVNKIVCSYDKL